ncbi:response regulator receiver protein [Desulfovibrio sp. X2]|uniref:response regulator n=1 Tax=Desulfovibrio sp. X2 TaxID=941449 RepID=UPI000358A13D|nr:response regulator [Desulfovibrio sp. X2]EPR37380.1 response regulator receiver protein [Desulfovibrio sp. X2]
MVSILIVDRNPHVREFLRRELAGRGYHILAAGSGEEMLDALSASSGPRVVVIDPDLPDQAGLPLLRRLAREFPGVRVVVHAHAGDAGLELAGTDVVVKNGRTDNLLDAVSRAAARSGGPAAV